MYAIRSYYDPDSEVSLFCGDIPMFKGHMGRKDNKIAIKVHDKIRRGRGTKV